MRPQCECDDCAMFAMQERARAQRREPRSERHFGLSAEPVVGGTFLNTYPVVYPACVSGPCKGGVALCPSPTDCQLPEGDEPRSSAAPYRGLRVVAWLALAGFALGALVVALGRAWP